MPLKQRTRILSAVCSSLLLLSSAALAGDKPSVEPRAERILRAAFGHIAAASSFMFRAETTNDVSLSTGQRISYTGSIQAALRRPDRVYTRTEGEDRRGGNWYDGKTLTHLDVDNNVYATWAAPPTSDELFVKLKETLGFTLPLSVLMRKDVGLDSFDKVKVGFYVGEAVVRGAACSHLAFSQEDIDWQIWVDNVVPVIRRVVITYKRLPKAPQYAVTFTEWQFNPLLPDSVFTFEPPRGATRAEFELVKQ